MKTALKISITTALTLCLALSSAPAIAQTAEEKSFLSLYFSEEELVVQSATRSPEQISRVAENVTVITAAEIERMNAHTLADVLNTVTGMQVFLTGGPGTMAVSYMQGSDSKHVTVMIDGIIMNTLGDNNADVGLLPVQMIQKIEIIKGPASSAWGSALGGIVNIITKSGGLLNQGNKISLSLGNRSSDDFRIETMGKQNKLGYYLSAGRLQSDGLTPHLGFTNNNLLGKLTYSLTNNTDILFSTGMNDVQRDTTEDAANDVTYKSTSTLAHSDLAINTTLNKDLSLNISLRTISNRTLYKTFQLSTGDEVGYQKYHDTGYGASAKLTWKNAFNTVVAGIDGESRTVESDTFLMKEQVLRTTAAYMNDTIELGKLSLTPGVRFDRTNTNGEATSPSLGIAYVITDNTSCTDLSATTSCTKVL